MSKTYCIFSANYLPSVGGTEKYTQNLAQALSVMGDHIIIVTMNVFDLPQHEELQKNIEILRLPCNKFLNGRYPIPKRNQSYRALLQQLEKLSIDYIVVNARFYFLSFVGMKLAVAKGITPIVIDHGSAHLTMGNKALDIIVSTSEHILTYAIKRYPAHYYSVSKASMEWLSHFGIKAHGVLNNAIDAKEFRNASSGRDFRDELKLGKDTFIVAYVGRFIPEKGIKQLVETAQHLAGDPSIHFLFAGKGPLEKKIKKQNLKNIHMLGVLSSSDVAALYLSANVNCLPSRSEGFASSLLEAAACGKTSIVTHVGGVDELMPTENHGILLKCPHYEDISDAILLLQKNPSLCELLGKTIYQRVESDVSWEKTAKNLKRACALANDHD